MRRIPVRIFIFLCMSLIIAVASLSVGLYLVHTTRATLVSEKQNKLFAFARLLDQGLPGTFEDILRQEGLLAASRDDKIEALNRHLADFTDRISAAQQGIGVGYYSKELNAIITYGPSTTLGHMVKLSINKDHQGWIVMTSGKPMVQTGTLVRGSIMNCMIPLIRNGSVIGYVWANELVNDINHQINKISQTSYLIILIGILFSFVGTALIAHLVGTRIKEINSAIKTIEIDENFRIPPMAGDLGAIARSINDFAERLVQKRKMEEQMQRTDRLVALGEIAAGVAHEIRNPLTSIKGFVQLIESEMDSKDPRRQYTSIVISETDRLNNMVHELLYYSRPNEPQKSSVQLGAIIHATLQLVRLNPDSRRVTINQDIPAQLPALTGDHDQLKQVLLNLIINAIQAVDNHGQIWISATSTADRVVISIEDNGRGIAPDQLNRLFDPFYTTRSDGTGLGLAVVQKIVTLHEGEIRVDNRDTGGARFVISLPISKESQDDQSQAKDSDRR